MPKWRIANATFNGTKFEANFPVKTFIDFSRPDWQRVLAHELGHILDWWRIKDHPYKVHGREEAERIAEELAMSFIKPKYLESEVQNAKEH